MKTLHPEPLSRESFAAFGEVIDATPAQKEAMNAARFERYPQLATVDPGGDGAACIGIVRCRVETALPCRVDMLERHPLGSQAFVPLQPARLYLVVAPAGASVDSDEIRAFVSNGRQGINYARGVWHMPLIGLQQGDEYLVIDRVVDGPNCDEHHLDEPLLLVAENRS